MPLNMLDPPLAGEIIDPTIWTAEIQNIINNPMDLIDPMVLNNIGAPTTNGELARNGTVLQFNNGSVRTLAFRDDVRIVSDGGEPVIQNTAVETALYTKSIPAGIMGSAGFMRGGCGVYIPSMLTGTTLTIKFYFGGGNFFSAVVTNATGSTQNNFGIHAEFRFYNRNSASAQGFWIRVTIPIINQALHVGGTGVFVTELVGGSLINTAIAQLFQVNGVWSSANSSNHCFGLGLDIFQSA